MNGQISFDSDWDQESFKMERRRHRRHDLESRGLQLDRADLRELKAGPVGTIVDLSAGGIRLRCDRSDIQPKQQVRVRLKLPVYAGITPFLNDGGRSDWIGWLDVRRVIQRDDHTEIAGELLDMDEMDRGMLGLYLSTQPLAA